MKFCLIVAVFTFLATTNATIRTLKAVNDARKGVGDLCIYREGDNDWIAFAGMFASQFSKLFASHPLQVTNGFGLVYLDGKGKSGVTVFSYTFNKLAAKPSEEKVGNIYDSHFIAFLRQHKETTLLKFESWKHYEKNPPEKARMVMLGDIDSNLNKQHLLSPDTESLHIASKYNEKAKTLVTVTIYNEIRRDVVEVQEKEINEIMQGFLVTIRKDPEAVHPFPVVVLSSSAKDFAAFILHQTEQKEAKEKPAIKFISAGGRKSERHFTTFVVLSTTNNNAIEAITFSLNCIANANSTPTKSRAPTKDGDVTTELTSLNLKSLLEAEHIGVGIAQNSATTVVVLKSYTGPLKIRKF